MRTVEIGPVPLGAGTSLEDAFERVFGGECMRAIHGPSLSLGDWKDGERTVRFSLDTGDIPREIARVLCGSKLRVTMRQTRTTAPAAIEVRSRMRMHFLGAELMSVRPTLRVTVDAAGAHLVARVEHAARLPPPLNAVTEAFMADRSAQELTRLLLRLTAPQSPP